MGEFPRGVRWEGLGWSEMVSLVGFYVSLLFTLHILQCFFVLSSPSPYTSEVHCVLGIAGGGELHHDTPRLGHPQRTKVKENPPSRQNFEQCIYPFTLLGGKMARCEIIYRFMDCSHMFAWMVRELEGTIIIIKLENWWQGNLGKRYRDIFLNEQQMWRYLCPSECSPKSDLSREF